jgi:hypothetical protein
MFAASVVEVLGFALSQVLRIRRGSLPRANHRLSAERTCPVDPVLAEVRGRRANAKHSPAPWRVRARSADGRSRCGIDIVGAVQLIDRTPRVARTIHACASCLSFPSSLPIGKQITDVVTSDGQNSTKFVLRTIGACSRRGRFAVPVTLTVS